jgi:ABC-2 type transport system ATP-binding protein
MFARTQGVLNSVAFYDYLIKFNLGVPKSLNFFKRRLHVSIAFEEYSNTRTVDYGTGMKSAGDNVISVTDLYKTYGTLKAVDGISFTVAKGEIFGLLGPNGAGKTTTVEMIEGLRKPDAGRIVVLDRDATKDEDGIKERIGIQPQAPALYPLLTVEEILDLFRTVYKKSLPTGQLMEMFSLQESRNTLVKNLSGGQQQRLSVAIAMVNDPDITFLDEPTTGLDPQARRNLWMVIEGLKRKGKTIVLTTHYMDEAEVLCDKIAIVDHGKIIAMGSPEDLIHAYFKESAIQFEAETPPPRELLLSLSGVSQVTCNGSEVVLYTTDIPATMSAILDYAKQNNCAGMLKNVNVRQATLEDVFLKITGRRIRE